MNDRLARIETLLEQILKEQRMLGISLGLTRGRAGASGPTATINGLTDGIAVIGDHASITASISEGTVTATKWGSAAGGSQYGTGTSPTDFAAGDEGSLYVTLTVGGEDYGASALIRYAVGTAPAVADGQAWVIGGAAVNIDGSASGANLTFTYTLSGSTSGVEINPTTGAITGDAATVGSGTATITATDQYGLEYTDTFTWTVSALSITATTAPVAEAMYHSQVLNTLTQHATIIATGNYASNAGDISTVEYLINGTPALVTDTAPEGADISILVTDEFDNTREWAIDGEVEAMYTSSSPTATTIQIDTVSSLPDGAVVAVPAIDLGDGATGWTMAQLRAIEAGTPLAGANPTVTYAGLEADLDVDDVLTGVDPGYGYSGTAPTITRHWESDNVDISGATGQTFTITADEQGTDVTFLFKPGSGAEVESTAVSVPSGAGAAPSFHTGFTSGTTLANTDTETLTSAFTRAGKFLVGIASTTTDYCTHTLTGPSVSSSTLLAQADGTDAGDITGGLTINFYQVVTSAASNLTIEQTSAVSSFHRTVTIIAADDQNLTAISDSTAVFMTNTAPTTTGLTATVASAPAGSHAFAMATSRNTNAQAITWGGDFVSGDEVHEEQPTGTNVTASALKTAISAGDFDATPTYDTTDGTGTYATALIIFEDT